ncbi:MAG: PQQ-dependent sugar dehydrogenase [Thaumarchaeota archaeon]|nr:PQQ-dependent sugar dehydrogenase [Nitrososphaerota archaeon]
MNKKTRIIAIAAAVAASILIITSPSHPIIFPKPNARSAGTEAVQVVAEDLQKPWAMGFGGNKIFFTEKGGNLMAVDNGTLVKEPVAHLKVADVTDAGLLGIAVDPDFGKNHFIYVYYTYGEGNHLWNRVSRITVEGNKMAASSVILDKIPGAEFDDGGVIKFGPDGKLYVGTGDASNQSSSQDLNSLAGKILRINGDGSIPRDNPFPNSPVYSYGMRDPQGLTWDGKGLLYEAEDGPTRNDEINLIQPGQNYGWPATECAGSRQYRASLDCFNPSIGPAGLDYYAEGKLDMKNSLLMATLLGHGIYKMILQNGTITGQNIIFDGVGRIRDVDEGPDGYLYVLTSNTDGMGFPASHDDKLLRIVR